MSIVNETASHKINATFTMYCQIFIILFHIWYTMKWNSGFRHACLLHKLKFSSIVLLIFPGNLFLSLSVFAVSSITQHRQIKHNFPRSGNHMIHDFHGSAMQIMCCWLQIELDSDRKTGDTKITCKVVSEYCGWGFVMMYLVGISWLYFDRIVCRACSGNLNFWVWAM